MNILGNHSLVFENLKRRCPLRCVRQKEISESWRAWNMSRHLQEISTGKLKFELKIMEIAHNAQFVWNNCLYRSGCRELTAGCSTHAFVRLLSCI